MLLRLFVSSCILVASCPALPLHKSSPETRKLAEIYAKLHPNAETNVNEEYGSLIEGDILTNGNDENFQSNPLNAVLDPRLKWPNGVTYYTIQNGVYTADQIARIEAGIRDLQELTKVNGQHCVRILPRETQTDYVRIENFSGCSSYVGRVGGSQRMSLVDGCVTRHGTIMHEFLHAFGFHHEHMRYDRDDHVDINWDNIQPGTENNFVKLSNTTITLLGTDYDYGSVMHYGAYGFAVDTSVPTIIPKPDPTVEIGQRETLSQLDIERVQIFYGCLNPADSKHFKHLARESI